MNQGIRTVLYPVRDIIKAKKLFIDLLGEEPIMDQPYYVGFQVGGQDIGLVPNGSRGDPAGPVGYYHVDDIHKSLQLLLADGAAVDQEIRDVGGGKLAAVVKDPNGNLIGLIQVP